MQDNQHIGYTWVLQLSNYSFDTSGVTRVSNITWSRGRIRNSEKVTWRANPFPKWKFLTLVFYPLFQLYPKNPSTILFENDYKAFWGRWVSYITGGSKLTLLKKSTIVICLARVHSTVWFFKSILSIPFPMMTWGIKVSRNDIPTVWDAGWVCFYCDLDLKFYENLKPFTGKLDRTVITYGYLKTILARKLAANSVNADLPGTPIINVYSDFGYYFGNTDIYRYNLSSRGLYGHRFSQKLDTGGIFQPFPIAMEIMADANNYTIVTGGVLKKSLAPIYFHGVLQLIDAFNGKSVLYPELESLYMWDKIQYAVDYCEAKQKHEIQIQNIFQILCNPFSSSTWLCLTMVLVAIFLYFKQDVKCSQGNSGGLGALFQITRLLLQKSIIRIEIARVVCLFGFLITEFYYLGSTTEAIIAPPKPVLQNSVFNLLQIGYKLWLPEIRRQYMATAGAFLSDRRNLFLSQFQEALKSEGMSSRALVALTKSRRYWNSPLQERNFNSLEGLQKFDGWLLLNRKMIKWYEVESWRKMKESGRVHSDKRENKRYCNTVKKRYGFNVKLISFYSKLHSNMGKSLTRILYDSGLRYFWTNMMSAGLFQKQAETQQGIAEVQAIKFADNRFVAINILGACGLIVSLLVCLVETRSNLRAHLTECFQYTREISAQKMILVPRNLGGGSNLNTVQETIHVIQVKSLDL